MRDETQVCPWCAETIKAAAIVCRYCGRDLPNPQAETDGLQRVRDAYGAAFDPASRLLDALPDPPSNRVAWVAELCKRIAAGSPPEAAAAKIPLDFGAAPVTTSEGFADFASAFSNRGPVPAVSGSFVARLSAMGDVRGHKKEDLLAVLGPPTAVSAAASGCHLLQWQKVSAFGRSYHYALIFDRNGYCGGITHQFVR